MWVVPVVLVLFCDFFANGSASIFPLFPERSTIIRRQKMTFISICTQEQSVTCHPIIIGNRSTLDYSPFDPEIATVIIIHGWTHGKDVPWIKEMREGLDPAAPLYEWPHVESLDELLDRTDANFVDGIHTNGRHLGVMTPVGHVDFYPNGGEAQPGCPLWVCSHIRAVEYWIASLSKPDLFKAYPYDAYNRHLEERIGEQPLTAYPMGIDANPNMPFGVYYVDTAFEYQKYVHSVTSLIDSLV
ncbi:unnamed protein product [Acanthoscelides obtectus]|uniref:Lipase domain-containing protein n=1 Tax=Acanthoscelides obtectus TaxID=200917 RepID=A0A9P0VUP1_ACAOB|nr:unnamed protein product [Acanthoscelides obtectus]CAK1684736.1 Phospholipase A1 member A [Acanthoscelides obtectus]